MNIAVIFAGGTGQRMNSKTRPKQFLELHEKPILVYTLEAFQKHEEIDGIILVTLKDWINYCLELKEKYHLTKLKSIIPGGKTATESAFNGLARANELFPSDSIVLIHDGVRPLVDEETITKNIECVKEHGTAITVSPAIETITVSDSNENSGVIKEVIERAKCQMARAPQGFYLNEILDVYKKAANDKETSFIDSATMMMHYGYKLYTVYEFVSESELGYIDPLNIRSCYPESKRMCENLCACYAAEYEVPVYQVRLAQTFGPGISYEDKRVFAMMARKAIEGKDIILQTKGTSKHPYVYTAQAVTAIFTVLLGGKSGEAYNVSNPETYCSIYEMGKLVSEKVANGKIKVIVAKNGDISKYPVPSCLKLDISKIENLGWKPEHNLLWMYNRLIKTM